jgi:hypothetical protein
MSEYGQEINPSFDPAKDDVYKSFYDYYNNPVLVKIKDVEQYSMYMTKIYAMLGNAYRYLILFVKKDENNVNTKKSMKECEWVSLQTRTLQDYHNIPPHHYEVRKTDALSQKIYLKTKDEDQSTYQAEIFPLSVTLLHTRKNTTFQYNQTGTLVSALETFQTIINF